MTKLEIPRFGILLLLVPILLTGCGPRPSSELSKPIAKAVRTYASITSAMTRDEVYRVLGQPQKKLESGAEEWRTADRTQVAVLSLTFSAEGRIERSSTHVDDAGEFVTQPAAAR
jgi:hypothetical protein